MNPTNSEKAPPEAPPVKVPDSPKNPIKQTDSRSETQSEIPKVGTTDAPGG